MLAPRPVVEMKPGDRGRCCTSPASLLHDGQESQRRGGRRSMVSGGQGRRHSKRPLHSASMLLSITTMRCAPPFRRPTRCNPISKPTMSHVAPSKVRSPRHVLCGLRKKPELTARGSSRARRYGRNLTRCVDLKPGPFLIGSPQHEATMTDGRTACAPAPAAQHPGGRRRACRVAAQGSEGRARDRAGRAWDSRDGLQRLVLFTRASSSSRQTGEHLASTWALA